MSLQMEVLHEFLPLPEGIACPEGIQPTWSVTPNPLTGSPEELCVVGKKVGRINGVHPLTRSVGSVYSMETEVLQAVNCEFWQEGRPLRGVCVRETGCLTLFMESGAVHFVPLPFLVKGVSAISGGLLVERQVATEGGGDGLPVLFTLMHPLDDFCPVTFRRPTATTQDVTVLGFFTEAQIRVLQTCWLPGVSEHTLLVCYDACSDRHSVWSIQPAGPQDIPSHIGTPRHSSSAVTPRNPLSTSAPSRYPTFTPLAGPLDTPIEMILSSRRGGMEPPRLPAVTFLQKTSPFAQLGGVRAGGRSGVKVGSGRSPFIARLHTPQTAAAHLQKRSKSVSPPLLARISPFSQTVNSRSWSTFYSEESYGEQFEPLVPHVCLHQLTQEALQPRLEAASAVFKARDLTGNSYLALLVSPHLWLLQYSICEDDQSIQFTHQPHCLPASQAIPLTSLDMILVTMTTGALALYSGPTMVSMVTLPMVGVRVEGLRDSLGDSFTIVLGSKVMWRCSLPLLHRDPVVSLCLQSLSTLLPPSVSHTLLCAYYAVSSPLPPSLLLPHFTCWLLACLGIGDGREEGDSEVQDTGWHKLQRSLDRQLLIALPALHHFRLHTLTPSQPYTQHTPTVSPPPLSLSPYISAVVTALHAVYEELKLDTAHTTGLEQVANLLHTITRSVGWTAYVDHYCRDFSSLFTLHSPSDVTPLIESAAERMDVERHLSPPHPSPPHLFQWLYHKLNRKPVQPFPTLPGKCKRTAQIIMLYGLYTCERGETVDLGTLLQSVGGEMHNSFTSSFTALQRQTLSPHQRVVLCMAQEGVSLSELETLPVGVALPLWDAILQCQETPPSTWPQAAYDIISRADIAKTLNSSSSALSLKLESPEDCDDGMNVDHEILRLRFPMDLRVSEARRLLQSFRPVRVAIFQKPEVSDHEYVEQQESYLLAVCQRTMALPVGRGMFSLSTAQPLPTAPLAIPVINLTGRAPPRNSTVGLEHTDRPANMTNWAEFHNGVAAGLKIAPGISKLDSTWIVFNCPSAVDSANEYAGFLMALGLNGHLTALTDFSLFDYLREKHELTVVGLLLGMAAARIGSMHTPTSRLFSIFLPPLHPMGSADMEVSHTIQTAGLVSVGMLYMGSGNRHLVEVMLREIGHAPGPELEGAEDRESYALGAGFALGMITLGHGGSNLGLSDLHITDKLCLYMNGGPRGDLLSTPSGPSHLVLDAEGEEVNTHVTSPAATVALGLLYLKTNDSVVAARLDTPSTQFELDSIRPDFLMLRALSRGLIMWDSVEPTQQWIDSNIPQIVSDNAFCKVQDPSLDCQTLSQAHAYILAGSCMAMGLKYAGTGDGRAHQTLLTQTRSVLTRMESPTAELAGKPCLERCLNTILLALAVVMSGSGDLDCLRIIRRLHVRVIHPEVTYGSHMATHMALGLLFLGGGRYSLTRTDRALALLLPSLYPHFPGTSTDGQYHLQALRHLYVLAAEPQVLVTRSVDSGRVCAVDVRVTSEGGGGEGEDLSSQTPCVLPEWSKIRKIVVNSSRHWPMTLDLSEGSGSLRTVLSRSGTVFVKERPCHVQRGIRVTKGSAPSLLSPWYHDVKDGARSLRSSRCHGDAPDVSSDSLLTALCQMCAAEKGLPWKPFTRTTLLNLLCQEKLPLLPAYLQLEHSISEISQVHDTTRASSVWQVKLAGAMCDHDDRQSSCSHQFVDLLTMCAKQTLDRSEQIVTDQLKWYVSPVTGDHRPTEREAWLLSLSLLVYDVPPLHLLPATLQVPLSQLLISVPAAALVRLHSLLPQQ